jgi:D-alanyl-D-alanine carboxypeptidase (penicillin-binding protein 5/6)
MNKEAARLGMKNTKFMNSSGLPDPQHYSTARDLQVLAAALIRDFPAQYGQYYSQKEFRYNNITQPNRNRLLWLDPTVDGLKTGIYRGGGLLPDRLVQARCAAAALGAARLDFGIDACPGVAEAAELGIPVLRRGEGVRRGQAVKEIEVWKGREAPAESGFQSDLSIDGTEGAGRQDQGRPRDARAAHCADRRGQRVGSLRVSLDGKSVGEFPVFALENIPEAGFLARAWDTLRLWLK